MKHKLLRYLTFSALSLSLVIGSPAVTIANATTTPDETEACYVMTLTSGTDTQTAGYTETTQTGPTTALLPASYSNAVLTTATLTETVIPPWIDPTVDANFIGSGASWISTHTSWPGGSGNTEGSASNDQWRMFQDGFTLPAGAVVSSAMLYYTADNATEVYQNGNNTPISSTNDVYGPVPVSPPGHYANVFSTAFTPDPVTTTFNFVVRNFGIAESATNPTGLLYKAVVNYCVPIVPPAETVTVTIDKYIDGAHATVLNAASASFPMNASWDAENIGAGSGSYALETSNSYQAMTVEMTSGADYATNEVTGGDTVAENCEADQPFSIVGYTSGNTMLEAQSATPTMTSPSFTNITNDKYVIVWNHDCSNTSGTIGGTVSGPEGELAVTSVVAVETDGTADNTYENGWEYTFNITVPTNETNLAMKFSDWIKSSPTATIPAGGNMKISSAQANNGGATVPIVAANTYSTPPLTMTGDLNPSLPGLQVQVKVQVKIPVGSANGAYTTSYGVQTLP